MFSFGYHSGQSAVLSTESQCCSEHQHCRHTQQKKTEHLWRATILSQKYTVQTNRDAQ